MRYYFDINRPGADRMISGGFTKYQDAERIRTKAVAAGEDVTTIYEETDDYKERVLPRAKMILATREGDVEIYDDGTQKRVL